MRVDDGTSDSPTCSRGKSSRSRMAHFTPAFARYAPIAAPAGPTDAPPSATPSKAAPSKDASEAPKAGKKKRKARPKKSG